MGVKKKELIKKVEVDHYEDLSLQELIKMAKSASRDLEWVTKELYNGYAKIKFDNKVWINCKQVQDRLSISKSTLRRYRLKYKLKYKLINGKCKYHYYDLLKIIQEENQNFAKKLIDHTNEN